MFEYKGKGKDKPNRITFVKKVDGNLFCTHCKKDRHADDHFWKLHPKLNPKWYWKGNWKVATKIQHDFVLDSYDETQIVAIGLKPTTSSHVGFSSSIFHFISTRKGMKSFTQ